MTDATKDADEGRSETSSETRSRRASGGGPGRVKAGANAVRSKVAAVVWLAAVVCALFLAVGALLIALKANPENPVVEFILDGANLLDGPFSLENGIFTFEDNADGEVKSALTNWGIAAVVYLLIGKILDRIIRP